MKRYAEFKTKFKENLQTKYTRIHRIINCMERTLAYTWLSLGVLTQFLLN